MQIPHFPESNHSLVKSLSHHSDRELLTLFQRYPEQGKYFTAIFCRYSPIVYNLISHSARSPVQADYLFALTWRQLFHEMRGLALSDDGDAESNSFQNWLNSITAVCIKQTELPSASSINYDLKAAPPPLWCYLEQALELLSPTIRFIVAMAETFHWSETRIAAYLQAEGEMISPAEVQIWLNQGHQIIEDALPEDIRMIYLGEVDSPDSELEKEDSPAFNP
ncbi:MAG: sigma-70 family RNA polymerase sigma factor [Xenococcaceae cyanobacterium]